MKIEQGKWYAIIPPAKVSVKNGGKTIFFNIDHAECTGQLDDNNEFMFTGVGFRGKKGTNIKVVNLVINTKNTKIEIAPHP